MSTWKHTLALGLAISPWSWADPKLSVDLKKGSDKVEIRFSQSAPFETVTQKWRENPHRLEITVPKVEWSGKASSNIDKGVLQRVEMKQGQGSVTVTVLSLQNPKMSWVSSADRKTWTLRIATTEMAASAEPPRLPNAAAVSAAPKSFADLAVQTSGKPVSAPPPVRVRPPATPPSTSNGVEQKLITLNLQNRDLPTAIREMARAAGLEADIGPGVEGSVTASFTDTPLARALTSVLGKQARLYEFKIVNHRLRVFADADSAGTTLVTSAPTQAGTPRSVNLVSDYFPIVADKPVSELAQAVRRAVTDVEVIQDDRLNVLFVRGDAADIEKVRNLLQKVLAK
ncbi:hypothetical protein IV102_08210 [bacterium]|nr:hypothetical protein [bacterium]